MYGKSTVQSAKSVRATKGNTITIVRRCRVLKQSVLNDHSVMSWITTRIATTQAAASIQERGVTIRTPSHAQAFRAFHRKLPDSSLRTGLDRHRQGAENVGHGGLRVRNPRRLLGRLAGSFPGLPSCVPSVCGNTVPHIVVGVGVFRLASSAGFFAFGAVCFSVPNCALHCCVPLLLQYI